MNGAKYKGRSLTVEFSVPKGSYEKRIDTIVGHTKMDRNEAIKPSSVRAQVRSEEQAKAAKEAQLQEAVKARAEQDAGKTKT